MPRSVDPVEDIISTAFEFFFATLGEYRSTLVLGQAENFCQ
jgi:hypothetical protein